MVIYLKDTKHQELSYTPLEILRIKLLLTTKASSTN